jgi:putative acetyltransferase
MHELLPLTPIGRDDGPELLALWESSVRATHHFLGEGDIAFFRPLIVDGLLSLDHLLGYRDDRGRLRAFLGVHGDRMEALFVDPAVHRQGLGRRIARHAVESLGVTAVDVNEQNPDALAFYQAIGFAIVDRSPLDGTGKPFPILHLRLEDR